MPASFAFSSTVGPESGYRSSGVRWPAEVTDLQTHQSGLQNHKLSPKLPNLIEGLRPSQITWECSILELPNYLYTGMLSSLTSLHGSSYHWESVFYGPVSHSKCYSQQKSSLALFSVAQSLSSLQRNPSFLSVRSPMFTSASPLSTNSISCFHFCLQPEVQQNPWLRFGYYLPNDILQLECN